MTLANLKLLIKTLIQEAKQNTKEVFVYHISDNANLKPQQLKTGVYSRKFGEKGLFTAPLDAIRNSWAAYASGKGRFGGGGEETYENMTLYKLGMPKWVFDDARREHAARATQAIAENPDTALGAWGWDIETFIPEDLLIYVRVAGKQTRKTKEFLGNPVQNVTYEVKPTSLRLILAASDKALKLLKKEELENVVEKLEYFLSRDWLENKIKEYKRERAYKAKYGTRFDQEIYSDFNPGLITKLEQDAEAERSPNKEAAKRKLSIARNLLKTKS